MKQINQQFFSIKMEKNAYDDYYDFFKVLSIMKRNNLCHSIIYDFMSSLLYTTNVNFEFESCHKMYLFI